MRSDQLKNKLTTLYNRYHHSDYLRLDPLLCVHRFLSCCDREIAGLVAASLAYGRAEIIIRSCFWMFEKLAWKAEEFTLDTSFHSKKNLLSGFKHRFNDHIDFALLFESMKMAINEFGSLENFFLQSDGNDIKGALESFSSGLKQYGMKIHGSRRKSFEYLLPSPAAGSACKRLNMYLRWMVRNDDSIDLGIWKSVSPSKLIIPVDTHIASIARQLKLTSRNSADWLMAEEITDVLRQIDPADPVRFDFSLCRAGMVDFRKEAA